MLATSIACRDEPKATCISCPVGDFRPGPAPGPGPNSSTCPLSRLKSGLAPPIPGFARISRYQNSDGCVPRWQLGPHKPLFLVDGNQSRRTRFLVNFQELNFCRPPITLLDEAWAIRMASNTNPSESLAWWGRAAQARRIAAMLSPRDAQLAEAYAAECEDRARRGCSDDVRRGHAPSVRRVPDPMLKPGRKTSPRRAA